MVPAENNAYHFSSVNHSSKITHHHLYKTCKFLWNYQTSLQLILSTIQIRAPFKVRNTRIWFSNHYPKLCKHLLERRGIVLIHVANSSRVERRQSLCATKIVLERRVSAKCEHGLRELIVKVKYKYLYDA